MTSIRDRHLPSLPTRDELRRFAAELRRESRVHVPVELDPRSPHYDRGEVHSAIIAVGAVAVTVLTGLTVGLVALLV